MTEWVFGYGSLVTELVANPVESDPKWRWAGLNRHRRDWGVAMENAAADADPKHYVDPTGFRPDLVVAFLDVYLDADTTTNGIIFPVNSRRLEELDRREVRYDRFDVTDLITAPGKAPGRVWTYRGKPEARDVARRGKSEGRAVVGRQYAEHCQCGFTLGGEHTHREFESSTDPREVPLRDLTLVLADGE